ncbi:MAG: lipopolysaccharide biosynthesis protein [Methyloligellaceae bacterium]
MSNDKNNKTSVEINKRLVYINSASSVFTRLLNVFVLAWMFQYLLKRISPEEFAIYPVVAAIMIFAPLFSTVFVGGVIRHATDAYAKGDEEHFQRVLSSILPLLGGASMILLVLGMAFSWYIDYFLTVPDYQIWEARLMMALMLITFLFETALLPYSLGFHVKQRYVLLNAITIGTDLLRILILLVLLIGVGPKVLWVVVSVTISKFIFVIIVTAVSKKMVPQLRFDSSLFDRKTASSVMSFGLWSTISHLSHMIFLSAGAIVLNKFGTPLDVTNYHVANTFHRQVFNMTLMASTPVMPALTAMNAAGDDGRIANAYLRGGRFALWAMLMVACPMMALAPEFIKLYIGDTFIDTAFVLILIMATYPFTASGNMLSKISMAKANVKPFALAAISVSLLNLAIMIYVTMELKYGAVGAAATIFITTSISQILVFWPMGMRLAKVSFGRFFFENLVPGILPGIAGLAVWLPMKFLHAPETWLELMVFGAAGMCAYGIVLLLVLKKYEGELVRMVVDPVQRLWFRFRPAR